MTKEKQIMQILLAVGIALAALVLSALLLFVHLWNQGPSAEDLAELTAKAPEPPAFLQVQETQPWFPPNPFNAEDFIHDGYYLHCTAEKSVVGIDVSKYQGVIDWDQVKSAGVEFVMIRIGGRGYGAAGNMYIDERGYANYLGAKEAGLRVGVYFFSQSVNVKEAIEEAEYALALTQGWELDMPIVYDWEYISETARTAKVDTRTLTDCSRAFCDTINTAGRESMIYVSPWFGVPYPDELTAYPQWLARYTNNMDYKYKFDMWQYTDSGEVPGIAGKVDLNLLIPYDDTFE